jgi:hypothetical protein
MDRDDLVYTREQLLNEKRDYSPFLVHLTKDDYAFDTNGEKIPYPAMFVLEQILDEKELKAFNAFCLFNSAIVTQNKDIQDLFKVTCFTETPIDQIEILTIKVYGRECKLEPYGLVFTKEYIREKQGNPVFYVNDSMFESLWKMFQNAKDRNFSLADNKTLALISKCDKQMDFHWEREWRIVGNLKFEYDDIFCGLCPEEEINTFESNYNKVKFISPNWGINKILQKLTGK